jgi:hypothetical protein
MRLFFRNEGVTDLPPTRSCERQEYTPEAFVAWSSPRAAVVDTFEEDTGRGDRARFERRHGSYAGDE